MEEFVDGREVRGDGDDMEKEEEARTEMAGL